MKKSYYLFNPGRFSSFYEFYDEKDEKYYKMVNIFMMRCIKAYK